MRKKSENSDVIRMGKLSNCIKRYIEHISNKRYVYLAGLAVIIFLITFFCWALARYVVTVENELTITLKDATIDENAITITPETLTNNAVVTIESDKAGEIYYKIGETGEWTKYETGVELTENCNLYAKLVYADGDGPETVKEITNIVTPAEEVASTTISGNTVIFGSVQEAINVAEENGVVTLLKDEIDESVTVAENQNITLDLNGKTIKSSTDTTISNTGTLEITGEGSIVGVASYTITNTGTVTKNGTSTIENACEDKIGIINAGTFNMNEGTIKMTATNSSTTEHFVISSKGNFNMSGGLIECIPEDGLTNAHGISIYDTGTLSIAGGTIHTTGKAIHMSSNLPTGETTVTITDGTIIGESNSGIYNNSNSNLLILGGSISSNTGHGIMNYTGGTIEVQNGTIQSTEKNGIYNNAAGTIKISGGTITGGLNGIYNNAAGNITVSGGNITVSGKTVNATIGLGIYVGTGTGTISGGTITSPGQGVRISGGNCTITAGTITSTAVSGVAVYGGTLTVGTNESTPSVSTTVPSITGTTYGVYVESGTFKLYDGIIKGSEGKSISTTPTATPTGYGVKKTTSNGVETAILVKKYQVSYNANGGTGAPSAQDKLEGVTLTLSSTVPIKSGYTFKGWGTSSNATTVAYAKGASYTANAAITLYAVWEGTATFDLNYLDTTLWSDTYLTSKYSASGTTPSSKTTVTDSSCKYGQYLEFTMPDGTSGGPYYNNSTSLTVGKTYTWSVFVKASSPKILYMGPEQGGRKDVNITTDWQKFTYTFTAKEYQYKAFTFYLSSGSTWTAGDKLYVHSLEIMEGTPTTKTTSAKICNATLGTLSTPSRTGYTFQGWYTAPVGGTKISSSTVFTANTTYYAQWTTNNYTVTYNYNGTKNYISPKAQSITATGFSGTTNQCFSLGTIYLDHLQEGDKLTISFDASYSNLTSVSGQTATVAFQGSGNSTAWSPGFPVGTKVNWTGTGTATYTYTTAAFSASLISNNYFNVMIRTDYYSGGTITISNIKVTRTTTETVTRPYATRLGTLPSPSEAGYTLKGWYTAKTGGTAVSTTTTVTGNATYYAQWTANSYTVTYDYSTNGGTSATKTSATVATDALVDLTPTATKDGWTFVGWNTSSTATTALSYLPMRPNNMTLYAIYSKTITATCKYYNNQSTTVKKTIYNTSTSASLTLPTIASQTVSSVSYTGRGWSTSNSANATVNVNSGASVTLSANTTYYASYSASITGTFYYCTLAKTDYTYSGAGQSSKTATATRYMNYTGSYTQSNYTVPTVVTGSNGGASAENYIGVSTSTSNATTVTPTTANTKFYAVYTESLTFYYYNGSAPASATRTRRMLSNGSTYSNSLSSAAPTPSAYDNASFLAWSYDSNQYSSSYRRTPLETGTNSLYAIYSKSITGKFNYYSGNSYAGAKSTTASATRYYVSKSGGITTFNTNYTVPSEVKESKTIQYNTFTFRGLCTTNSATATVVTATTANTTFYATYYNDVTITFDDNGAIAGTPIDPITGKAYANSSGSATPYKVTMPEVTFGKGSSYHSNGWNTNASGTGTNYAEGQVVSFYGSKTLYVRWVAHYYKNLSTGVYYDRLNDAFKEVASTTEQTYPIGIKVLTNVTETTTATVPSGKRVTLILNSKTITLSNVSIVNNGTMLSIGGEYSDTALTTTEKTGTITQTGTTAAITCNSGALNIAGSPTISSGGNAIYVKSGGNVSVSSGKITGNNEGIYSEGGYVNVSGGIIKATSDNGIHIPAGYGGTINVTGGTVTGNVNGIWNGGSATVNITGGTITGTNYSGVSNYNGCTGTLNIGSSGSSVSTSTPVIQGKTSGAYIASESKAYFYSGRIRGVDAAVTGTLNIRSGYKLYSTTQTISGTTYKVNYLLKSTSTASLSASTLSLRTASLLNASAKESLQNEVSTTENISENNEEISNKDENSEVENNTVTEEETADNKETTIIEDTASNKENLQVRLEGQNNYNENHSDTTTIWTDLTENKNDAIITDGTWGENYLELNGTTSFVEIPEINSEYKTIQTTFSVNKLSETDNEYIISNSNDGGAYIFISNDGYVNAEFNIDGTHQKLTSTTIIEEGKIYDVAITYDGNVIKLYINGVEESKLDIIGTLTNPEESSVMLVGANPDYNNEEKELGEFFNGKIYTISIYNEALSDTQVYENSEYNLNLVKETTTNPEENSNEIAQETVENVSEENSSLGETLYTKTEEERKKEEEEDDENNKDNKD